MIICFRSGGSWETIKQLREGYIDKHANSLGDSESYVSFTRTHSIKIMLFSWKDIYSNWVNDFIERFIQSSKFAILRQTFF